MQDLLRLFCCLLDLLEGQLRRQERAFRNGGDPPRGLSLERPDVPMTAAETVRATDLMQRTDALIDEAVQIVRVRRSQVQSPYAS